MKNNKKALQLLAAIWILAFHIWIPIGSSTLESFLVRTGYIGVDLFFFLSAWSLSSHDVDYRYLLGNRGLRIYIEFIFFILAAAVTKSWKVTKILKSALFIDFFENGGGAFLWFIPAILLLYCLYPLFLKWKNPKKELIVLLCWLGLSLALQYLFGYTKIFIFTNRIPAILLATVLKKVKIPTWASYTGLVLSIPLLYFLGFREKLNLPIREFYFVFSVLVIPALLSISSRIPERKWISILGGATLELYGLQMVWGTKLATAVYRLVGIPFVSNLITILLMIGFSLLLRYLFTGCLALITSVRKAKTLPS